MTELFASNEKDEIDAVSEEFEPLDGWKSEEEAKGEVEKVEEGSDESG